MIEKLLLENEGKTLEFKESTKSLTNIIKTVVAFANTSGGKMEISNPGGLPFGMTMERALGGSSRVRNRVIARVFKELKLIEQWGSGLRRIVTSCAQHGLIAPKFEDGFIDFQVTLYNNKPATGPSLNIADKKLVLFLKDNKRISTKDAALLWGITPR